jgi:hypothetical protein
MVDARVDRHHGVKHTGVHVGIQLNQDLGLGHRGLMLEREGGTAFKQQETTGNDIIIPRKTPRASGVGNTGSSP